MEYLSLTLPGGQTVNPPAGAPSGGTDTLATIMGNAMTIMLIVAVVVCLIFLVLGGMQWMSSGGDKQKIAGARAKLTWAIVGLLVALGAFAIVNLFGYFFGVDLLNITA